MPRKFNPTEFREEALDLMKVNPELAAKSVTTLARKHNAAKKDVESAEEATKNIIALLLSLGVMAGTGAWAASIDAKRDAFIADWEESGAEEVGVSVTDVDEPWKHERGVSDPGKIWFVPKLLLVPVGFGIVSAIASAARKGDTASTFERFASLSAMGTAGLFIARMVGQWVYKKKELKLEAANNASIAA